MYIKGNFKVQVEEKIRKRIQTRLKRIGQVVAKRARILAPVRTGKLKRSIHWEVTKGKVEIIADTPYAYFVETGEGRGPAQPFLRPALHGTKDEIARIMGS